VRAAGGLATIARAPDDLPSLAPLAHDDTRSR
jgi:hypothetical protein